MGRIYTLGHSTYPKEQFLALAEQVDVIIDVRSHPGSAKWPWFDKHEMEQWLPAAGKGYEWWPGLGGWREVHAPLADEFRGRDVDVLAYAQSKFPRQRISKKRKPLPLFERPTWTCYGFWDYSWFQTLPEFLEDAAKLLAEARNVGLVCCESRWPSCHRAMISDTLAYAGVDSFHLSGYQTKSKGFVVNAKPHSEVLGDRLFRYDPEIIKAWAQLPVEAGLVRTNPTIDRSAEVAVYTEDL